MRIATRAATFALAVLATGTLLAQQAGPAPGESLSQSYRGSQARNVEYQKIAPFKVRQLVQEPHREVGGDQQDRDDRKSPGGHPVGQRKHGRPPFRLTYQSTW